ncbi:MAG: PD-(D/E)XK nuclease family protein [Acidobacteriaceae bacterium]|nr:PD-(D/E)XK nuclease family protein [Acidobacteriaceae bacterium]
MSAAVANQQFIASELLSGQTSWERPAIYSLNAWLANCWQQARFQSPDCPVLLSGAQERFLWRQIVAQTHPSLFDLRGMADMAMRAARMVAEWHIPARHEAWDDHEDAAQFKRWHDLFRQTCRQNSWIARADIWRLLPAWCSAKTLRPGETVFAGFENPPPALRLLVEAEAQLFRFGKLRLQGLMGPVSASGFDSFAAEVEHAARWARGQLENNKQRSIGVFIPELRNQHSLVSRTFRQIFYPAAAMRSADREDRASVFHLRAGRTLADHPLIAGALLLLQLVRHRISTADAGAILRSPYLPGASKERSQRALADVALRRRRCLDLSFGELEWESRNCPVLARLWQNVQHALSAKKQTAEHSYWSEFAGRLLKATGWPGDGPLTDGGQRGLDAWDAALGDLASLDLVAGPVTWEAAADHLRELLSAPEETGDWSSPVQILDVSEAAGLQFDTAMVCGLSSDYWRKVQYGSPLIPLKLQRAAGVPGSSPEGARTGRERLVGYVLSAAPALTATYSIGLSSPIPFISQAPAETVWSGRKPWDSFQSVTLQELFDSQAPALANGTVRGGTSVIKAQSQCPFRAFSEYRLRAVALEDGSLGMDALARGTTLHKALEVVWRELKNSCRLQNLGIDELRELVQEAIGQSIRADENGGLRNILAAVERERLEELILEWLELERGRTQPFSVEFVEQKRAVELAGLHMEVRLDRIDRLTNGRALLIDYKSGAQTKNKLLCPRPGEPQLLVYAATAEDEIDGVILAQVQARACKVAGFTRNKQFNSNSIQVKGPEWDEFLDEAQQEVARLAAQFRSGWAAVDPSKGACEYCSSKTLCRVNESVHLEQEQE